MKFLFGDKVKIVGGFYQGIEGIVLDYSGVDNKYYFEGRFNISEYSFREINTWINEKELEKVEE
jgi:hypothetical protein